MNTLSAAYYESPIGCLEITATERGLRSLTFCDETIPGSVKPSAVTDLCTAQLDEYFAGKRTAFELPLDCEGTEFQKRVWDELLTIPFGQTLSYLDIAERLGDRNFVRAVGSANGKNKVWLVVPCHRVIGSNKSLTGYAGGLWRKEWLLNFEKQSPQESLF